MHSTIAHQIALGKGTATSRASIAQSSGHGEFIAFSQMTSCLSKLLPSAVELNRIACRVIYSVKTRSTRQDVATATTSNLMEPRWVVASFIAFRVTERRSSGGRRIAIGYEARRIGSCIAE